MCPLWQCGTKTLVCTPQIKEIKTTTTTKHGSTTASFIHNSSCNQLLCHFIFFCLEFSLLGIWKQKQLSYLFWPPLTTIDSVWGRFLWGQGKNVTFSPNQKSSSFSKAYLLNLIVINIYIFSIAKFFTYHFDHHRNRIYMALLSWNLYFHDILNKIKKNIPALNCIFFLYIWFEWIVHTNAKMIEQIIKKCLERKISN